VRTDLIRLWLLVAIAAGLAIATNSVYKNEPEPSVSSGAPPGEILFLTKGCSGCHAIDGVADHATFAPNLTDVAVWAGERVPGLRAAEYVRQSLREPQAFIVPGFDQNFIEMPTLALTDREIDALVEFLLEER
jgi:mono/diheme cytochrome c family protein